MNVFYKIMIVPDYGLSASQNIGVVVLCKITKKDNHSKWLLGCTRIVDFTWRASNYEELECVTAFGIFIDVFEISIHNHGNEIPV